MPLDLPIEARVAVRALCGLFLLPHTIAKLMHMTRASQLFDRVGFRPARFFVIFTALMELVAAGTLITGVYARIGASIAAIILVGASYAIGRVHGLKWRWQHPGIEYMIFWAATALSATFLP
jgi:putative oxidoreductase